METKDIKANNVLIAEFIGERGNDTETVKNVYINIPVNGMKEITVELDRMKFHKSWDWLMPVLEKIQNLGYRVITEGYKDIKELCSIEGDGYYKNIYSSTKIEAIYKSVVEFIKWHNLNK